jgi:hypothetical protein
VEYHDTLASGDKAPSAGIGITFNGSAFAIGHVAAIGAACGFQADDEIAKINGTALDFSNYQQLFASFGAVPSGVDYDMTVRRNGEEQTITCQKKEEEQVVTHVLELEAEPAQEELALREAWMVNLKPS